MDDLLENIEAMRGFGYDSATIEISEAYNALILRFLDSPIGDYVRSVEGQDDKGAAGGSVLGVASIKREITEFHPGAFLFPRGYLPIWSCDGNLVVYGLVENQFFWAFCDSWFPSADLIVIPESGEGIPFSEDDVPKALVFLSDDHPNTFVSELLEGAYDNRLRELP